MLCCLLIFFFGDRSNVNRQVAFFSGFSGKIMITLNKTAMQRTDILTQVQLVHFNNIIAYTSICLSWMTIEILSLGDHHTFSSYLHNGLVSETIYTS